MNFCLGHESAKTVDLRGQRGLEEKFNVSDVYLSSIPPNQMMIPLTSFSCGNKIAFFNDCSWVWVKSTTQDDSNMGFPGLRVWMHRESHFTRPRFDASKNPGENIQKDIEKPWFP